MKLQNSTASILLFFTVLLSSCGKEGSSSTSSEKDFINQKIISQIVNLPEDEQRTAFRLLNNYEMAFLWSSKLKNVKTSESLSSEQKIFINELIDLVNPDLFLISSKTNIEFKTNLAKNITQKARMLFGDINARKLIASVSPYKGGTVTPNNVDPDEGGVKKCKCSTESNYCDPLAPCDEQLETVCKHTLMGCGALLLFSCNGLCRPV
ncbi:MAG TPA: bacteriocin fulvocin C-related protein [Chitinophagaceae bacterium]